MGSSNYACTECGAVGVKGKRCRYCGGFKMEKIEKEDAEVQLGKLRGQKPVGFVSAECISGVMDGTRYNISLFAEDIWTIPVYANPVPAPAVLKCWLIERPASSEWPAIWLTITTDGRRWVSEGGTMYATGGDWYFTTTAVEALKFADKESADEYVRHNKIKDVVVTEHIFDNRALLQSTGERDGH